jgi:protein-disulfide isomerase
MTGRLHGGTIAIPKRANQEGDGIVVSSGAATVDVYIDFQCPFCRQFEWIAGPTLGAMAADGRITLVYHPMNFLDAVSTNRYSTRAAAASGCASDGGMFARYAHALFVNQLPEGGPGLTDEELIAIGVSVGPPEQAFGECVHRGTYLDWPTYVTERATARGVNATPTVLVEDIPVAANPTMIAAAVDRFIG